MNRHALAWADIALELQEENRALRDLLVALVIAYLRHRGLCTFAHERVDERWEEAA
jgi:hypothetical protein